MTRARRPWVLGMMLFVVSCGGDAAGPELEGSTSDGAWGEILAGGIEDGVVPLDVALQSFQLAIGDLPGVEAPETDQGVIKSGSAAIRWTLRHLDELTAEQQDAVSGYLQALTAAEPEGTGRWPVLAAQGFPLAASEVDEMAILSLITQMETQIGSHLGRELGVPIELVVAPTLIDGKALATALGTDSAGFWFGKMTKCTITITKSGTEIAAQVNDGLPSAELVALIAHEVFHCFEAATSTLAQSQKRPSWVVEGLAEWAGETVSGGSELAAWQKWLTSPSTELWKRTYDAIGFYSHLDEHGADMWGAVDSIIAASDQGNESAYTTAISAAGPDVLPTWGPGAFRDPTRAPAWDQDGPGIKPLKKAPVPFPALSAGDIMEPEIPRLAAAIVATAIDAQVVTITGSGHGMVLLPDGSELSFPGDVGTVLCTEPGGCTCPEGTAGASAVFRITERGETRLGLTGHLDGATFRLQGWDLDQFCEEHEPGGCLVGVWEVVSYSAQGQEVLDGSGGGIILAVDGDGDAVLDFNDSNPILTRMLIDDAPWVQVRQVGTVHFQMDVTKDTVIVGQAVSVGYHIAADVQLGDVFIEAGPGMDFNGPSAGGGSTLQCEGDTLVWTAPGALSQYEMDRISTDGEDVAPPPEDGEPLGGDGGASPGEGGSSGPPGQAPELPEGANACSLLTLEELGQVFPDAAGGEIEDAVSGPLLRQCTYTDGLFVSIQPPASPQLIEGGMEGFEAEVVVVDGIGDWARAFLNEGDAAFGIVEGSVFMVSAGNEKGTVNFLPWPDVIAGTAEYEALLDLLELALSRL